MDDAMRVNVLERFRNLDGYQKLSMEIPELAVRESVLKVLALHPFHDDVRPSIFFTPVIDLDDVRVIKSARRARFLQKPYLCCSVWEAMQNSDHDTAAKHLVAREIDRAHTALTNGFLDDIFHDTSRILHYSGSSLSRVRFGGQGAT